MATIIIIALLVISSAYVLAFYGRRALERRRLKRMSDNTYDTALTLWNFARIIKDQLDNVSRGRAEVIDFTEISVPAGTGYNVSLELAAYGFRMYAVPERYQITGRLSLYVDNSLTVRAWDHAGENATAEDPEYAGEDSAELTDMQLASSSRLDWRIAAELLYKSNESRKQPKSTRDRVIQVHKPDQ